MTKGFGEKCTQKARDAHSGMYTWVSQGPSGALPSLGNQQLSIPYSPRLLSSPLTTHHSQAALAGAHSMPQHMILLPQAQGWQCLALPGRSSCPLLLVQTQISLLFPLTMPHRISLNTKKTKTKGETWQAALILGRAFWFPERDSFQYPQVGREGTPWSGHDCFGQPITLPPSSKNTGFLL